MTNEEKLAKQNEIKFFSERAYKLCNRGEW